MPKLERYSSFEELKKPVPSESTLDDKEREKRHEAFFHFIELLRKNNVRVGDQLRKEDGSAKQ